MMEVDLKSMVSLSYASSVFLGMAVINLLTINCAYELLKPVVVVPCIQVCHSNMICPITKCFVLS
jgi:hypothetical protein